MKGADLYFNGVYLGSLYEDGTFEYEIKSSYADKMDINAVVDYLELIRMVGKEKDFDFDTYLKSWHEYYFNDLDAYEFIERY